MLNGYDNWKTTAPDEPEPCKPCGGEGYVCEDCYEPTASCECEPDYDDCIDAEDRNAVSLAFIERFWDCRQCDGEGSQ